jgi:class 3 adenylate cyclase/tetratricopeptide (TPR) repeat protein
MICPTCGTENLEGKKFCKECGTALTRAAACGSCGAALAGDEKFCDECGAPVGAESVPPAPVAAARESPAAERRLVTVLFTDLVGFTPLSESRDPEEVRELLSRYFDLCRRLIELYGGTVEKFIGDAVMAVWGTPVATEDDAERAVRAALDLVAAVSALGQEVGAEDLRARAGVLTGEAAVTIGAESEGMVAGDLVNTASRVQSVAEPGSVYVGESTRRATEQAIVYEEAGSFELKGKEGLTPLWKADRVVSGVRGTLKSHGLEAPFVGRDRELRQIKGLFHNCADERTAQLVSVTGVAGLGKSRLSWEFYKYFDGIALSVYWHRGRCLAYGEGVTYWALADMVRWRCRIAEDEAADSALEKLRTALDEHIPDPEERRFVEPRLAHLLGLGGHESHDRQDLFAAWRLFFERLADVYPTVLAFEDMQWADASLLDFVEYLLDWSRNSPLFVITFARPELLERRPSWGAGHRNFASLYLDPLPREAMEELLTGLVPGLPAGVREQILARAEGVPLYAMETVRMLLDRGALVQQGSVYRPVGTIEELEVPETLHALIAARLDGLSADERRLLQDGAVLGKTFTRGGLAALAGLSEKELDQLLQSLVRKEVISLQSDPRSPEYGQYGFLQELVRHVAYETLSKRERRARHLAAAEHLAAALSEDEVTEVVASHLVEAYRLDPGAEDAGAIKERARLALVGAGDRAESLAAAAEARRYFEEAAELADRPSQRADLIGRAGVMAGYSGDPDAAQRLLEESIDMFEAEGDTHAAARASGRLGRALVFTGRRDEAVARLERAFEVISADEPDQDLAMIAAQLSRAYWFSGDLERAAERAELALDISESQRLPEALVFALRAKGAVAFSRGHGEEAFALTRHALNIALEHDLGEQAWTLYFILSDGCFREDRYAEALAYLDESLALARKLGSRPYEWSALAERTYPLCMLGRWEEVLVTADEFTQEQVDSGGVVLSVLESGVEVHVQRGELDEARRIHAMFARLEHSTDLQDRCTWLSTTAALRRSEGRHEEAISAGTATIDAARVLGTSFQSVKHGVTDAIESALALGDNGKAQELLGFVDGLPKAGRPPFLEAQSRRFRALMAKDADGLEAAARLFRDLEAPFPRAVALLEHAELTGSEESLTEAREVFERLDAVPWLERISAPAPRREAQVSV